MLAGDASSAFTTSLRSSARAGAGMRTILGVTDSTATACFRQEAFHQLDRGRIAPVALAEAPVARPPLCVDDERHRQPAHLPCIRGSLLGVHEHRQREGLLRE